jgi:ketosteroid isomerase-like protein
MIRLAILIFAGLLASGMARAESGLEAILAADRAFAALSLEKGAAKAFEAYAANDAISFGNAWEPIIGPAAIAALVGNGGTLEWVPVGGKMAASGELGYTWGRWKSTPKPAKPGDTPKVEHGKYVTIWQKQGDGKWKFTLDTGAASDPPPNP